MKYEDGEAYDIEKANNIYYWMWFEMVEHYLDKFLPGKGKVLDAGGGTGEFTLRAAGLRPDLSFINFDLSHGMLETARKKILQADMESRISNQHGDIMNMPFESGAFDYVMCLGDAFSFCTDFQKAFSELARVTGRKGCFIFL